MTEFDLLEFGGRALNDDRLLRLRVFFAMELELERFELLLGQYCSSSYGLISEYFIKLLLGAVPA